MKEPYIQVGIISEPTIKFTLLTPYILQNEEISGQQEVELKEGQIYWQEKFYKELCFEPINEDTDAFELNDVTIGINFHWERKEDQRFLGKLKIIADGNKLVGINMIRLEDYLTCVISSEMSATASLELLKAHAVISRSWLLAQIQKNKDIISKDTLYTAHNESADELIKWYDREDHTLFDVCADDHCQRYQGITRASTEIVKQAIGATRGEVLMYDDAICDARYSKCCGGALEEFEYCWEDIHYPYLAKRRDSETELTLPDLQQESIADDWIQSSPDAFCNTKDKEILGQVLNNYDQETTDFYRWTVSYTQQEIAELIKHRSGIDFGAIKDLTPIARGTSGRLWKLKITGTKRSLIIGKELEIRRTLSASHLYSSAFVVSKEYGEDKETPTSFTLNGAGWGHGVGLCQIGAAVMGQQGYNYQQILLHYYTDANIKPLYQ